MSHSPPELHQLISLLPLYLVNVRQGGAVVPHVPSIAIGILRDALAKGYPINQTSGDLLGGWDGWIEVDNPDEKTFVETRYVKK